MERKEMLAPIHQEQISKYCFLSVLKNDWYIEYHAQTLEEYDDMNYKVTSQKVEQFLSDLKNNLQLFLSLQEEKKKGRSDIEGLRDMIIRIKGSNPGIYLTDQFCIASSMEGYEEIKKDMEKAAEIAAKYQKG